MASIAVHLKPRPGSFLRAASSSSHSHLFSSSPTQTNSKSSSLSDLKSHLTDRQPSRNPYSFKPSAVSMDQIQNNMKEFRLRSSIPDPIQPISLQELYKKSISETGSSDRASSPVYNTMASIKDHLMRTKSPVGEGLKFKDRLRPSKGGTIQTVDVLSSLGGTPSYMFTPPKEHLVEKYFHPDNMSSAEKLKLESKRVRDEFKMSDTDCGSTRVQIAKLTTEIGHLSKVLHKKDKHSLKGLIAKVQLRKKLLKYLRRTDWDSYCFILSKLGLRDNPGYKQ